MAKYTKKLGLMIAESYGLGKATVEEICTHYGIVKDTFYNWKKTKSEFSDAIEYYEDIRLQNLGLTALNGLELLLTKHEFIEEKTLYETYKENGQDKMKVIGIQRTKKFVMPNARMVELALYNRLPDKFKNASHIDHTSKGESLGFGMFLQQTKPAPGPGDKQPAHKIDVEEEEEVYTPFHREPKP